MRIVLFCTFIFLGSAIQAQNSRDTTEAHYPGGQGAWMRYLNKNFQIPAEVIPEQYSALLVFHVSTEGKISKVRMLSGDTLLLKTFADLLINSSTWVPAKVGTKPVVSTRYLPISYHHETE